MKDLKIFTNNIEEQAKEQINLLLEQEAFKNCKVRIMPDVHAGAGCVIGFTGNLGDKVIPNIVGVDIGCGMLCINLGNIEIDFEKLDNVIKTNIPSGMNVRTKPIEYSKDYINEIFCKDELKNKGNWLEKSLGSLGGGNHFIEIDIDDENNKYLIIHTGSRNLGKQVAEIYQSKAIEYCSYKEEMEQETKKVIQEYIETGKSKFIQQALVDIRLKYAGKTKLPKDLCYLENNLRQEYLHDMKICQKFAYRNRIEIAETILKNMNWNYIDSFQSVHNYIDFNDNIVRKGSISAKKGQRVIIPMNMRDGCIIGIGKGNNDWNCSAPHGAGRTMSRNMAKQTLNMKDFENSMKGIYTTSVSKDTIDESPMVYKPMEEILKYIDDTIEVDKIIKPIYNFKAGE